MVAERYEAPKEEPVSPEKEEFLLILEEFRKFVYRAENSAEAWEVFEDIVSLRASFLIDRVLTGLRMDFDRAFDLLKNFNSNLTDREKQEREILVAAIENLVDFAVAEEFQMIGELPEELDIEDMEEYEETCEKYNLQYASVENEDVLYSASMAYWWIGVASNSIVTYMTQGDERVRASHLSLEGISFPKSEFPADLIPPIDYACRCYLLSDGRSSESFVTASIGKKKIGEYKKLVNPVFAESLATGGKIFSDAHPYFKIPKENAFRLREIADKIKSQFI